MGSSTLMRQLKWPLRESEDLWRGRIQSYLLIDPQMFGLYETDGTRFSP